MPYLNQAQMKFCNAMLYQSTCKEEEIELYIAKTIRPAYMIKNLYLGCAKFCSKTVVMLIYTDILSQKRVL